MSDSNENSNDVQGPSTPSNGQDGGNGQDGEMDYNHRRQDTMSSDSNATSDQRRDAFLQNF
jgi:hypothetical protein